MKLLIFTNYKRIKLAISNMIGKTQYEAVYNNFEELTSNREVEQFDAIIVDRKTWQTHASLLKYFGLLDALNQKPLLVLANEYGSSHIKFRDSKSFTGLFSTSMDISEFTAVLDKAQSIPA